MPELDMSGRVVLVTGATDGLGRGLCLALAQAGADVLAHGRSAEKVDAVAAEIRRRSRSGNVRTYRADLSSLEETRGLAREIREHEPALHVLVNNAGIGTTVPGGEERLESRDGIELRFAVNYLAGFLLTRELLDVLRASAPSRIVNVSSAGQMPIDFDDVMLENGYSGVRAYCQSKLAQILFTFDLAAELLGSGVTATALHPATYMPTKIVASPLSSLEEGVEATMRLIGAPDLDGVSGVYFNGTREAAPDPQAEDPAARARLREISERLVAQSA
jgi:NAD(P)-dependent dehydrogenase (short-subunit alcohol dehydrogenase family)